MSHTILTEAAPQTGSVNPAPRVYIDLPLKERGMYLIGALHCLLRGDTTIGNLRSIKVITDQLIEVAGRQLSGLDPGEVQDAS